MPNWSDENGNCHFEVNGAPCYQSPDKCPMHGGSTAKRPKTKTTTELTRLRRENADMARALEGSFKRGAEAMRESVLSMDPMGGRRLYGDMENFNYMLDEIFKFMKGRIKELPIPEDK